MREAEDSGLPRMCGKLNSRDHSIPTLGLGRSLCVPLVTAIWGSKRHRKAQRCSQSLAAVAVGPEPPVTWEFFAVLTSEAQLAAPQQ